MDSNHYNNDLLKLWRGEKDDGLTQEQVAKDLGVHRITVVRAENGTRATWPFLCRLASYYGKQRNELLRESLQSTTEETAKAA